MTKSEFIATLIIMKWKQQGQLFMLDNNKVLFYSDTAVTTINGWSCFHKSYKDAITRISKNANICTK